MVQIIPDGEEIAVDGKTFKVFISHMVQIIHKWLKLQENEQWNFISHMVQIIRRARRELQSFKLPLYPTWFR